MTKVAIMQPTFLPWLGYFAMIDDVDVFVFLDDVQFSKQSWQNRNRIKSAQGKLILTVSCKRKKAPICSTQIDNPKFYRRLMRSIEHSYASTPFKKIVITVLEKVFSQNHTTLGILNSTLVNEISKLLEIQTHCFSASELGVPVVERNLRLLRICEITGANTYLSTPRSLDYWHQHNPFESSRTNLRFFSLKHPEYPQLYGSFEPKLSIIDAIANVGTEDTLQLLHSGIMPSLDYQEMTALSK